ncbi:hypothetical protein FIV37_20665 [Pseudomonas gessardii]|nr:hypothetical protein [Pseudomonas gessardii]
MLGSWELNITCRARSPVGAGLPAMQTTRCISDTAPMPSQASQLLHQPCGVRISGSRQPPLLQHLAGRPG